MTTKADWPTDASFGHAAWALDVDERLIRAMVEHESAARGAFDERGRPTILFERHKFHKFTGGRFDGKKAPGVRDSVATVSSRSPGGYGRFSEQWPKLQYAITLDREAALKSASYGLPQIMGFNFAAAGATSVDDLVERMSESADSQLRCLVSFILSDQRLVRAMRMKDFRTLKVVYNGPAENDWAERVKAIYQRMAAVDREGVTA